MKIYKNINVYDEALNRIRRLFGEFENVVIGISGGKDSTIIYNLSLIVAKELGRLPLTVMFIDQEAEWEVTIEEIIKIMYNPEVDPHWYQMPFQIFNAVSVFEHWLQCWEPGKEWMREKDPISIKENVYNEVRYARLFGAISRVEYANEPMCYIAGVRTEESPTRFVGLTHGVTYKDITWGKILDKHKHHYTFYPIYDWSYADVWKAIFDNEWSYNELYNWYYMGGRAIRFMRVSNLHHEKAVSSLFVLQEYEPATYEKLVRRLKGVDMAGKFGQEQYFIHSLPFMFKNWVEYRDYLVENLLDEEYREIFRKKFKKLDILMEYMIDKGTIHRGEIQCILTNDWEFVKLGDRLRDPNVFTYFQFVKGLRRWEAIKPSNRENIRREGFGKFAKAAGR